MIKTQIQLPDHLYEAAKRVAAERELSLAEVIRRGVEYITRVYPPLDTKASAAVWELPPAQPLGRLLAPERDWRELANASHDRL